MAYYSLGLLERGKEKIEPAPKTGTTTRVTANTPGITTINVGDGRTIGLTPTPSAPAVPLVIVKPAQGTVTTVLPDGRQSTVAMQPLPTPTSTATSSELPATSDCPAGQFFANKTQGCIPIPGITGTKPSGGAGIRPAGTKPTSTPIYEDNIIPGASVGAASSGLDWKIFAAVGAIGLTMFFVFKKDKVDAKV